MICQDVDVSWIDKITFLKRGFGVKIWQKLIFGSEIANFRIPFAATDTQNQQREAENLELNLI